MRSLLVLFALALLGGCAADRAPNSLFGPAVEPQLVVDALLLVGQPLPRLYLRRTAPLDAPYQAQALSVSGARVTIRQDQDIYIYSADPDSTGQYLPPADAPLVQAQTTYLLEVDSQGQLLSARTSTPARLVLAEAVLLDPQTLALKQQLKLFAGAGSGVYSAPENQVHYLEGLLEVRFVPVPAAGYQVAIFSLDPDSPFLADAGFGGNDGENRTRQDGSPALATTDGKVNLPWFTISYGGRHLYKVFALDQNCFDYLRTTGNGGPGGLAGDNFERPLFHIEGGIGLFGSASVDLVGFFVLPRR